MPSAKSLRQPAARTRLLWSSHYVEVLGVVGLRSRVTLWLDLAAGQDPTPYSFVVDSGASYSLVSLEFARLNNFPVPPPEAEVEIPLTTAGGAAAVRVRPGRMRGWWTEGLRGYPFDWPVLFRVGGPPSVPPILGLGGVVQTCRWTFEGTTSRDAPYGSLMLEDIR